MKETNNQTIEDLRTRLKERAELLLKRAIEKREKAASEENLEQLVASLKAKPAKLKKNQIPKSSGRFEKWLAAKIQKASRFPKRVFGGFQSHLALYEELQRFASETGKAGEEINQAHKILQSQTIALATQTEAALASANARITQSDCSEVMAFMSRELTELRRKVEFLSQQKQS